MKMSNETFVNRKINENVLNIIKKNIYIVAYILQMIFILIYTEPQLQPFVYVRF
jgi:hypothetical protein